MLLLLAGGCASPDLSKQPPVELPPVELPPVDITRDQFHRIFRSGNLSPAGLYYYFGEQDGYAYVAWNDLKGTRETDFVPILHYFRVPATAVDIPLTFKFRGWDTQRWNYEQYGDVAVLENARVTADQAASRSQLKGISGHTYSQATVLGAPDGTFAFILQGSAPHDLPPSGYLYAPSLRPRGGRPAQGDGPPQYTDFPFQIQGVGAVKVVPVAQGEGSDRPLLKDCPWLENWFEFKQAGSTATGK
jgi:hypothetical protein